MTHIVADEQVEMSIAVVIKKGRPRIPVVLRLKQAGLPGHVGEGAIPVVTVQHVLAVIGNKQVQEAIVVVISHADSLAPTRPGKSRFRGYICKCSVVVVPVKVI